MGDALKADLAAASRPWRGGPIVWWSFKVYCAVMVLLLGGATAFGVRMMTAPEVLLKNDSAYRRDPKAAAGALFLMGALGAGLCAPPLVAMLPGLVWPRSKVAWYLGFLALAAGTFTMGGWLFSMPLLVFWGQSKFRQWCRRDEGS